MYEHLLTHGSPRVHFGAGTVRPTASHGGTPPESPTWPGPPSWICIHSLPAHWHQGYGKLLLEKVLRGRESAGYPSILLWVFDANLPAIRFYQLGLTPGGRKRPSFGSVEEMHVPRPSDPHTA